MITLKKSFELSNYFDRLVTDAECALQQRNVTVTAEKHFRSKSYAQAEDETRRLVADLGLDERITINDIIGFSSFLVGEICRLNTAIETAKGSGEECFDALVANNTEKHRLLRKLRELESIRSSETKGNGYDYKFNDTGDQVKYAYPLETVTTINFDRNAVKSMIRKLRAETDETSDKIELLKLGLKVDFETVLTLGDSFEEAVLAYIAAR